MPSPYSKDLRERVLKAVEEKKVTLKEIGETFKLNVKTIYLYGEKESKELVI